MKRAIVADDHRDWRNMYSGAIRKADQTIQIDEVETGRELVERVLAGDYFLVITDNDMEGRDSGLQAIRAIRAGGKDLPIYLVSGHSLEKAAREAGATGFYGKGLFECEVVANDIRKHLGGERK